MSTALDSGLTVSVPFATPEVSAVHGVRLARAADDLWRVVDRHGRVVGHVQIAVNPLGLRYRARRYHAPTGQLRALGDFWSVDDAVACLRYA